MRTVVSTSLFKGPLLATFGFGLLLLGAFWAVEADKTDHDVCVIQNCTPVASSGGGTSHPAGELQSDRVTTFWVAAAMMISGALCLLFSAADRWD